MIKLLTGTILGLSILGSGTVGVPVQQVEVEKPNQIIIQEQTENLTSVQWHNNQYTIADDEDSLDLFEKYSVNAEEAQRSSDVYIQEEYVRFDEVVPVDYANENSEASLMNIGNTQQQEYIHNEGYIKFITKAYAIGFYDGNIVYHVEVTTEQQKHFKLNYKDNLIIRHGEGSITLNNPSCDAKGEATTRYGKEQLDPNYSCSSSGVYYTFAVSDNTVVIADYYLIVSNVTEVQPVYVHNYVGVSISVSLSFEIIGVSIDIPKADVMEGKSMTLRGYARDIKHSTHTMNPVDWGFDERYYFENEGLKYTTKTFENNDFTISTERLRCGYIEEESINLSPNRAGAGDAYLYLEFNKPVYEIRTNVSLWSTKEAIYSGGGDYAYIQYMDENGNWITCADLLNMGLSKDRTAPTYIEYQFVKGTTKIRFIAHKENPTADRNKGRICIKQTTFITDEIN